MKRIIYLIMLAIFLTIPINVKADTIYFWCESTNLTKLQKLASNITSSYYYVETFSDDNNYGSVVFTVKINNLNEQLYLVERTTGKRYDFQSSELVISNVEAGQTLSFGVYGNDYGCEEQLLITIYVNIPPYNKYYKDELCKEFSSNNLCSRWYKVEMSYEDFKSTLLKSASQEEISEEEEQEKTFQDIFIEVIAFLDENKLIIFGPIILISAGLIIYLKYLKKKDEFDLK